MSLQRTEQLLRLAGSENEHEALAALRALIRLKTRDGKDWNDFVSQLAAVQFGEKPSQAQPRARATERSETKPDERAFFRYTHTPNPFDDTEFFEQFLRASWSWRRDNEPPREESKPEPPPKPPQPTDEEKRAREAEDLKRRDREDQKRREATREDEKRIRRGDFSGATRLSEGFLRRRAFNDW